MLDKKRFCNRCGRDHEPRICEIGEDVDIHPSAIINVSERLVIGHGTKILAHAKLEGRSVVIGRECFFHEYSWIGGGGCFDSLSHLVIGDWFHLGRFAHINTATQVIIGDQVGIGHQSSVWTHGGYLPVDQSFCHTVAPTTIGDNVWIPHGWINPGVNIGSNVVVAAMSLVNRDLPDNCFAAGIPARPRAIEFKKVPFRYIIDFLIARGIKIRSYKRHLKLIEILETTFDLKHRMIIGNVSEESEKTKDLLRRMGIRFRYQAKEGIYIPWEDMQKIMDANEKLVGELKAE